MKDAAASAIQYLYDGGTLFWRVPGHVFKSSSLISDPPPSATEVEVVQLVLRSPTDAADFLADDCG